MNRVPEPTPDREPLQWLLAASHTLAPADLGDAVARATRGQGASDVVIYLVDHDQLRFHPLAPRQDEPGALEIAGTIAGRAFTWERIHTETTGDGAVQVWAPLIDGTARLGVMRVEFTEPVDDRTLGLIERLAALTAELIVAKGQYTDIYELTRRHRPMSLMAELQRSNLPPVALVTDEVAVAGALQPAYEVAGDSFDYALNTDRLHVAILDSVGHDLDSSLISHLVQGSLRNSRRRGLDLAETYAVADEVVADVYPDQRFATAAFGTLDLGSGLFRWISAGHPAPLLIRGGDVEGEAQVVPTVPIGLRHREPPTINEVVLAPGDALVLYTDGVTEGGARGGERFGLERFVEVLRGVLIEGLPSAEILRRLIVAVLEHTAYELHDDAGIVLVQRRIRSEA